jgi:hypothetical protein
MEIIKYLIFYKLEENQTQENVIIASAIRRKFANMLTVSEREKLDVLIFSVF